MYDIPLHAFKAKLSSSGDSLQNSTKTFQAINSNGSAETVTLEENACYHVYRHGSLTASVSSDTLPKGITRNFTQQQDPSLSSVTPIFANNAWIKQDTLYGHKNCPFGDLIKMPVNEIYRVSIAECDILSKARKRNVIWFEPTNATDINGFSLGLITDPGLFNIDTLKINGMNLNVELFWAAAVLGVAEMAMMIPFVLPEIIFQKKEKKQDIHIEEKQDTINPPKNNCPEKYGFSSVVKVTGVNIGVLGTSFSKNIITGVNIAGIGTTAEKIDGLSVSGLACVAQNLNGVGIAGIINQVDKGKGIQIGLINYAKDFQGVQFGLWNKIGKLGFPFINFRFKKNKKE